MKRAIRRLSGNRPLFCAVVVSLGLGIGGTTAVFRLIQAVMLRSLHVREPERLVSVTVHTRSGSENTLHSYPFYLALRNGNRALSGFLARVPAPMVVGVGSVSERVSGELVSGNYFDLLGVHAAAGRLLTPADEAENEPVCVVSHGMWKRMLGASPDVVGKPLIVNGRALTLIGVTSDDFRGVEQGESPDVRVPLSMVRAILGAGDWTGQGSLWLYLLGRLQAGSTIEQAQASVQPLVDIASPRTGARAETQGRIVLSPAEQGFASLRYRYGQPLVVLMSVVTLAFLLSGFNVLILLFARMTSRSREIATCMALGAGRARLFGEFALEGVLFGVISGLVGTVIGHWTSRSIVSLLPASAASYLGDGRWDLRSFVFTMVLSIVSGCVLSLSTAAFSVRTALISPVNDRNMTVRRGRLLQTLVASQIAISLVLVMSALLFVGTLYRLRTLDLGFHPDNLVLATIDPSLRGREGMSARLFCQQLMDRLGSLEAVDAVSLARVGVLSGQMMARDVDVPGRHVRDDTAVNHYWNKVTPSYFKTMGIPIRVGRDFGPNDQQGSQRVAIINERMAQRYWPVENPVGRRFNFGREVEIVGVVGDSKYLNLRDPNPLIVYTPLWQSDVSEVTLHVRTRGDVEPVMIAIRSEAQSLDKSMAVYRITTMQTQIEDLLVKERLLARLSVLLGLIALVLATGGLYSTVTFSVERRSKELAIRMALGADRAGILGLLLREKGRAVAVGAIVGTLSFLMTGRFLSGLLFAVEPTDLAPLGTVVALFGLVTLLGTLGPVLHAAGREPAIGLRHD